MMANLWEHEIIKVTRVSEGIGAMGEVVFSADH